MKPGDGAEVRLPADPKRSSSCVPINVTRCSLFMCSTGCLFVKNKVLRHPLSVSIRARVSIAKANQSMNSQLFVSILTAVSERLVRRATFLMTRNSLTVVEMGSPRSRQRELLSRTLINAIRFCDLKTNTGCLFVKNKTQRHRSAP